MDALAKELIDLAIKEDVGRGDITTQAIFKKRERVRAKILAKANGIVAGLEVAQTILDKLAPDHSVSFSKSDGDPIQYGNKVLELEAWSDELLTAERTILNFMQRMSGVATATHKMVQLVSHTKAKVLDTRKTTPGHRFFDKWAVRLGGGENHRMRLDDRYLIKENHIAVAGGIEEALEAAYIHREENSLNDCLIEIEVPNLKAFDQVLSINRSKGKRADIVMLDNMSNNDLAEAVRLNENDVLLEASGNVTLDRIGAIAETGVDFISTGSITHSVQALDLSMLFESL